MIAGALVSFAPSGHAQEPVITIDFEPTSAGGLWPSPSGTSAERNMNLATWPNADIPGAPGGLPGIPNVTFSFSYWGIYGNQAGLNSPTNLANQDLPPIDLDNIYFGRQGLRTRDHGYWLNSTNPPPNPSNPHASFNLVYTGSDIGFVEFYVGVNALSNNATNPSQNNQTLDLTFIADYGGTPISMNVSGNMPNVPNEIDAAQVLYRFVVPVTSVNGVLNLTWSIVELDSSTVTTSNNNPQLILDNIRLYKTWAVPPAALPDPQNDTLPTLLERAAALDSNSILMPITQNRDRQKERMSRLSELDRYFRHYKTNYWPIPAPTSGSDPRTTVTSFTEFLRMRHLTAIRNLAQIVVEPETIAIAKTYSSGYLLKFSDGTIVATDFAGGPAPDHIYNYSGSGFPSSPPGFQGENLAAGLHQDVATELLNTLSAHNGIMLTSHHHGDHVSYPLLNDSQLSPLDIKIIGPRKSGSEAGDSDDLIEVGQGLFSPNSDAWKNYFNGLDGVVDPTQTKAQVNAVPMIYPTGRPGYNLHIFQGRQIDVNNPLNDPMNYSYILSTPDGFKILIPGEQNSAVDFVVPDFANGLSETWFERYKKTFTEDSGIDLIIGTILVNLPTMTPSATATFDEHLMSLFGGHLRLLGHEWELDHANEIAKRSQYHDRTKSPAVQSQGAAMSVGEIFVFRRYVDRPRIQNLTQNSVDVQMKTSLPVRCSIKYWPKYALEEESATVVVDDPNTYAKFDHLISINGLMPGTNYKYRVLSDNGQATSSVVREFGTFGSPGAFTVAPSVTQPASGAVPTLLKPDSSPSTETQDTRAINDAMIAASVWSSDIGGGAVGVVTLATGKYYLGRSDAVLERPTHLYFDDLANVRLEGGGNSGDVELIALDLADGILVEDGSDITLKNLVFNVDADKSDVAIAEPPFFEGKVVAFPTGLPNQNGGNVFRIEIPIPGTSGFADPVIGANKLHIGQGSSTIIGGKGGIAFFDPQTRRFKKKSKELDVTSVIPGGGTPAPGMVHVDVFTEDKNNVTTFWGIEVGDLVYVASKQINSPYTAGNAIRSRGTRVTRLTLENITVNTCWRGAFSLYQTDDAKILGCRIEPSANRLLSSNRDGFYFTNPSKGPTLIGNVLTRCGDDGMNLHGDLGKVTSIEASGDGVEIEYEGEIANYVGSMLEFFSYTAPPLSATSGTNLLVSVNPGQPALRTSEPKASSPGRWKIKVADPTGLIANSVGVGDRFFSVDRLGGEFLIEDNVIRDNRGRGILIRISGESVADRGRVVGNLLEGCLAQAIVLGPEINDPLGPYPNSTPRVEEAGFVRHVDVDSNTIRNVAFSKTATSAKTSYPGAISVTWMTFNDTSRDIPANPPTTPAVPFVWDWPTCHENLDIRIRDNEIENVGMVGIFVANAENVVVSGNRVRRAQMFKLQDAGNQVGLPSGSSATRTDTALYFHEMDAPLTISDNATEMNWLRNDALSSTPVTFTPSVTNAATSGYTVAGPKIRFVGFERYEGWPHDLLDAVDDGYWTPAEAISQPPEVLAKSTSAPEIGIYHGHLANSTPSTTIATTPPTTYMRVPYVLTSAAICDLTVQPCLGHQALYLAGSNPSSLHLPIGSGMTSSIVVPPLSTTTPYHFLPGVDPVNEGVVYNSQRLLTTDLPTHVTFWAAATELDVGLVGSDRNENWQFTLEWTDMTGTVSYEALGDGEAIENTPTHFAGTGTLVRFERPLVAPPSGFAAKYLVFKRTRSSAPAGAGLQSAMILDSVEVQF